MKEQIRILHVLGGLNMGGIENLLINIYRNIDREKVQFDFLIHQDTKQLFEDEIVGLGGKIKRLPNIKKVGILNYIKLLKDFFCSNREYRIIHSHYNEISGIILFVATICKIKYKIAHSHIAYPNYSKKIHYFLFKILKILINSNATYKFACSKEAGEWLFNKENKFKVISNGIEVKKFIYKIEEDIKIRKELNCKKEDFNLVAIGRLTEQKNHIFMLKIMKKLNKIDNNIKLYLLGEGELENKLKEYVEKNNIRNIYFLGVRKDTDKILNGMDLMLFPSLYEGLGIVAIEAQSNGLQVLASENVPKEADMNIGLFKSLDIIDSDIWVKEILELKGKIKRNQDEKQIKKIQESNYNIITVTKELEKFYLELE